MKMMMNVLRVVEISIGEMLWIAEEILCRDNVIEGWGIDG